MMRTRRNRSRALLAPGSVPVALAPLAFTLLAFTASAEPMDLFTLREGPVVQVRCGATCLPGFYLNW
jgi:hypothetical protein